MPRIRTIKPDFWDSADTAGADLRTRLLFIAMWNWADDYGIGDATPVRVIGFAFPNDEIPVSDYPRLLSDVSDHFGVVYFRHEGRPSTPSRRGPSISGPRKELSHAKGWSKQPSGPSRTPKVQVKA
ncbi:hypothetical protein SAMN04488548_10957 [Gordonia westfalica]|uniref:Uncharacterized protein n=1 Tax=Gordonia westfalica TaxID=158898 RepID=A0A1H2DP78_9ACTN|nr:hypothetical protein SAMN04488548_10957 [Gordonia westfalica]